MITIRLATSSDITQQYIENLFIIVRVKERDEN